MRKLKEIGCSYDDAETVVEAIRNLPPFESRNASAGRAIMDQGNPSGYRSSPYKGQPNGMQRQASQADLVYNELFGQDSRDMEQRSHAEHQYHSQQAPARKNHYAHSHSFNSPESLPKPRQTNPDNINLKNNTNDWYYDQVFPPPEPHTGPAFDAPKPHWYLHNDNLPPQEIPSNYHDREQPVWIYNEDDVKRQKEHDYKDHLKQLEEHPHRSHHANWYYDDGRDVAGDQAPPRGKARAAGAKEPVRIPFYYPVEGEEIREGVRVNPEGHKSDIFFQEDERNPVRQGKRMTNQFPKTTTPASVRAVYGTTLDYTTANEPPRPIGKKMVER